MVNSKKVSPKGNYKETCLGCHEMTTFSGRPNAFGHSEAHFWSYEGSENGKLKKLALMAITKRNALAGTK